MRKYHKFNLKDHVGRNSSSYISDEINNVNKATTNIYPTVSCIIVTDYIKKQLDSKSMNLMNLLDLKTLSERFAVSDIISLLALQSIGSNILSVNNTGCSTCNDLGLEYIWRLDANKDEKLHIFYEANLSLYEDKNDVTFPTDVIDILNTYINEKESDISDIEPYKLLIGDKINPDQTKFIVPVFIILSPGIGEFFNVSENKKLFLTEYVKLLYSLLPIWTVSTLPLFKDYFNTL